MADNKNNTTPISDGQKNLIESLSKEEIIAKYKGLLGIAKKAKQAKDELLEENRQLKEALSRSELQKEADKSALITMKEMLEEFTANKLTLTNHLSELQKQRKSDVEALEQLQIENESLKRQLNRLTEDNDSLLLDIDRMERQLQQVNIIGMEQKQHLALLELEVNKLKETDAQLQNQLVMTLAENKELKDQENENKKALEEERNKYKNVKEISSNQRAKFNTLKDRFVDIYRKLKKLKECKKLLLETHKEYSDSVARWQNEIVEASHMLCRQIGTLKNENNDLLLRLQETTSEVPNSTEPTVDIKNVVNKLKDLFALSKYVLDEQENHKLKLSDAEQVNESLCAILVKVLEKITEYKKSDSGQELIDLTKDLEDVKMQLCGRDQMHYKKLLDNIDKLLTQQQKVLEVIEINESTLKTQQNKSEQHLILLNNYENQSQTTQTDFEEDFFEKKQPKLARESNKAKEIQLEKELHEIKEKYNDLRSRYEQKTREHTDLLDEMRELNEALKGRGDVISRQEEKQQGILQDFKKITNKMEQFENSLTEKEKMLNEKNAEILNVTKEIESARHKVAELETICCNNEEHVRSLNEELQSLRNCSEANVDNQSDVISTSTISRADEFNRLRELDESFEEKYNKLRNLAVKLKKKLQEQTVQITELDKQQQNTSALKIEHENYKQKINDLQKELEQNSKQIETLKAENQKLKSLKKQAKVLNLEIEAAEKSLTEVTAKLTAKTQELETLNEALKTKETNIVQLRKEMAILEAAKEAECNHSKELKEQIDLLQTQVKDAVHSRMATMTTHKELEQMNENLKLEIEELRLELSKSASKSEKVLTTLQNEKLAIEGKLFETEKLLKNTQQQQKNAERALEELRIEHLEYKLKAQTVLRKNQSKDVTRERELEDELNALRTVEKQMQISLQMHIKKLEESNQQIDELKSDNANCQRRIDEYHGFIEQFRQENENLTLENRRQTHIHQETLRNHLQQIENLENCHKQQLQDLEANYLQQIEMLKMEIAKTPRVPPSIGASSKQQQHSLNATEQSKLDLLLMEREDAEGSEAGETLANLAAKRKISNSSRRRSQHEFMPLDELLNEPMNTFSDTVTTITAGRLGHLNNNSNSSDVSASDINSNAENLHNELQATKEGLERQESRVRHLTTLLAENEQDLARLTQMNDMLKEELRRQERAVEREKHMHNSEYVKNVIIKFLTLHNCDERLHLVPVLNTILKLTRDETEVLNCVAKGQKVSSDSQSNRGWSNFLSSWSGSGSAGQ